MNQNVFYDLFIKALHTPITNQEIMTSRDELWAISTYILESLIEREASVLMNSLVLGTHVPIGSRVLGSQWIVDPAQASFQHALLINWKGRAQKYYSDHNFLIIWATVLSLSDYLSRKRLVRGRQIITIREVFELVSVLRRFYVNIKSLWSDQRYNRWIMKILSGTACLMLMNKSHTNISSLWGHLTLQGFPNPYPHSNPKEAAWAAGLDLHQTVMTAYSVVQIEKDFSIEISQYLDFPRYCDSSHFLDANFSQQTLKHELSSMIQKAHLHPDLGRCKSLLDLENPIQWEKGISWLLSQCSLEN
jgi:hypothetical protein